MTQEHDHDGPGGRDAAGPGAGRALYAWEVEIFRRSSEGSYSRESFGTVRAPSLLAAYTRTMEQAVRRARDPDDEWHGSEFAYPRGIARRLAERGDERQARGGPPEPPARMDDASGPDEAPDGEDPNFDSLADTYR